MKYILLPLNVLAGMILVRFTVSKFAAWPVSVAAFGDMAQPLGIDPTWFRIGTGFVIGIAALSFFLNAALMLWKKADHGRGLLVFLTGNLHALGAMSGALFAEFFLRSATKWPLVYIAAAIMVLSAINLVPHLGKLASLFRKNGLLGEAAV